MFHKTDWKFPTLAAGVRPPPDTALKKEKTMGETTMREIPQEEPEDSDVPQEVTDLLDTMSPSDMARDYNIDTLEFMSSSLLIGGLMSERGKFATLSMNTFMPITDKLSAYARLQVLGILTVAYGFSLIIEGLPNISSDEITREICYVVWVGVNRGWWDLETTTPPPGYEDWVPVFEKEATDAE